jgi:hypothetical protein
MRKDGADHLSGGFLSTPSRLNALGLKLSCRHRKHRASDAEFDHGRAIPKNGVGTSTRFLLKERPGPCLLFRDSGVAEVICQP